MWCEGNFHMGIVISQCKEHAGTSEQRPFKQTALSWTGNTASNVSGTDCDGSKHWRVPSIQVWWHVYLTRDVTRNSNSTVSKMWCVILFEQNLFCGISHQGAALKLLQVQTSLGANFFWVPTSLGAEIFRCKLHTQNGSLKPKCKWKKLELQKLELFMYSGNRETFCICNTCCTVSVLFPPKLIELIILSFLVLIIFMFSANQALKFKYPADRIL